MYNSNNFKTIIGNHNSQLSILNSQFSILNWTNSTAVSDTC